MKLPSIQFYPGDWRKDPGIQALNYEERGIWMELLFLMHESEVRGKLLINGKPPTDERLAHILHIDKQKITTTISTLVDLGVARLCPDTGALFSKRMIRDTQTIEIKRNSGKMGGNPAFQVGLTNPYYKKDKQKDNQEITTPHKQKITPSSSSSSSSSIHRLFISNWSLEFQKTFGVPYKFDGVKDGVAASSLLKLEIAPEILMETAKKAWSNQTGFWCKKAVTIAGFSSKFNDIRAEVGELKTILKENVSRPPNSQEILERLQNGN